MQSWTQITHSTHDCHVSTAAPDQRTGDVVLPKQQTSIIWSKYSLPLPTDTNRIRSFAFQSLWKVRQDLRNVCHTNMLPQIPAAKTLMA